MLKRLFICCIIGCYVLTPLFAQSDWLEWNEDITASEELEDWREKYEELRTGRLEGKIRRVE